MGTRSAIGIVNTNGTIDAIYCHWDGYPDHNGAMLLEHYTDTKKVRALIKLGNLSSLGVELGTKHDFYTPNSACNFYGRDRNEPDQEFRTYASITAYELDDCGYDYWYLFDPKKRKWSFCSRDKAWTDLGSAFENV